MWPLDSEVTFMHSVMPTTFKYHRAFRMNIKNSSVILSVPIICKPIIN